MGRREETTNGGAEVKGSTPSHLTSTPPPLPTSPLSLVFLGLAALLAGLLRWETRTRFIYGWDTVHYVLAQDRYDVRLHQPHPPGSYYYVFLAKLLRGLTGDAHTALLLVGALFSALLVVAAFFLARELDPQRREASGWLAVAITGTAPLFWFFGSVGLNYGPNGALTTLAALLFLRTARRSDRWQSPLAAGVVLGLIGGFRPTDVAFLLPAYLWSLYRFWAPTADRKPDWKPALGSLGLGAAFNLGWLVPSVLYSGGIGEYLAMLQAQEPLLGQTSVFGAGLRALREPLITHRRCLEGALGAAWPPLLAGLGVWLVRQPGRRAAVAPPAREMLGFAALFTAPAFAFYLLLHFNSPGYALTYCGLLAALGAVGCAALLERPGKSAAKTWRYAVLAACLAAGNTALFWFGWPGPGSTAHRALSGAELRDHDRYYRELRAFLNREYGKAPVRIICSWNFTEGLRVVQAALPDRPDAVVQPMKAGDYVPALLRHLTWFRLVTPAQVRREGRPVIAVVRTREDPPYHQYYFGKHWDKVSIGPGHIVYRLRTEREPAAGVAGRS